jgi:hypothetical protein
MVFRISSGGRRPSAGVGSFTGGQITCPTTGGITPAITQTLEVSLTVNGSLTVTTPGGTAFGSPAAGLDILIMLQNVHVNGQLRRVPGGERLIPASAACRLARPRTHKPTEERAPCASKSSRYRSGSRGTSKNALELSNSSDRQTYALSSTGWLTQFYGWMPRFLVDIKGPIKF